MGTGAQSGVAASHPTYARGGYVLEESVLPFGFSLEERDWWLFAAVPFFVAGVQGFVLHTIPTCDQASAGEILFLVKLFRL